MRRRSSNKNTADVRVGRRSFGIVAVVQLGPDSRMWYVNLANFLSRQFAKRTGFFKLFYRQEKKEGYFPGTNSGLAVRV